MSDPTSEKNFGGVLEKALAEAEALQARIEAGEAIAEEEIQQLARLLATQMEEARSLLESVVGPVDPEALKAHLKVKLSPEEYEQWLAGEEERLKFQAENTGHSLPTSEPKERG